MSSTSSCGSCSSCSSSSPLASPISDLVEDDWTDISGEVSSLLYNHEQLLAIDKLLKDTLDLWLHSIHADSDERDIHSQFFHQFESCFHQISNSFAGTSSSALRVLVALFDLLGAKQFLECCVEFLHANLYSHLLSWAFQFVKEDAKRLAQLFTPFDKPNQFENSTFANENDWKKERERLVEYVNKEAAIYECFPQHGKLPRINLQKEWWDSVVSSGMQKKEKEQEKPNEKQPEKHMEEEKDKKNSHSALTYTPAPAASQPVSDCQPIEPSSCLSSPSDFSKLSSSSSTSCAKYVLDAYSGDLCGDVCSDIVASIIPPKSFVPLSWRFLDACFLSVAVALPVVAVYVAVSGIFSH